jgi:flavin reductase (DIM6/NTAB) family NADH-FMN oxidoreductase RutF
MNDENPIAPADFRRTLGNFCTGIAVITGTPDGKPVGFTVQSLVSLSLAPPLVGFSPAKTSGSWRRIRETGRFCVNILTSDQAAVCAAFAKGEGDRFLGMAWDSCGAGLPVLSGSLAFISCLIADEHETGDHTFVVGRVEELSVLRPDARPLLFFRGIVGEPAASVAAVA